jgi:hypothetical protein
MIRIPAPQGARRRGRLAVPRLALAVALVAVTATAAHAQGRARKDAAKKDEALTCEVVEIDATVAEQPWIDPALKDLEKKLRKGPFAGFNRFSKLARQARTMSLLKSERFKTPRGAVDLIIREIQPDKKRARLSLGVRLEQESGKQYLETKMSVDTGDFLLFARTVSDKQSIVTAVGCR